MFIVGFALAGLGHRFEWMMLPWWTTVFEVLGLSLSIGAQDIPENALRENAAKLAAHKTNSPKKPPSNNEVDGTLDAIAILTGAAK